MRNGTGTQMNLKISLDIVVDDLHSESNCSTLGFNQTLIRDLAFKKNSTCTIELLHHGMMHQKFNWSRKQYTGSLATVITKGLAGCGWGRGEGFLFLFTPLRKAFPVTFNCVSTALPVETIVVTSLLDFNCSPVPIPPN